jgi:putative membrane protein insertion efficiency factor
MKALALAVLRLYKRWISPSLAPSCRYVPTCSEYAMEAIERYGVLRGGAKALWRLLRCHPFVKGGLDPVVKKGHSRHDCVCIDRVIEIGLARTANSERRTASNCIG